MPSLDELYNDALKNRRGPYGARNPAPPPSASPPPMPTSKQWKEIKFIHRESMNSDTTEQVRGRPLVAEYSGYNRREDNSPRDTPQRGPSPDRSGRDERRGRQRPSPPRYHDEHRDNRRYRERSSQKSKSPMADRKRRSRSCSPSIRRSIEGRERPRSPPREDRDRDYQYRDEREYEYRKTSYSRRGRQRSLTPVAVRERRIRDTNVPETAYPLRDYTNYIAENHGATRRVTRDNCDLPAFRNGDGKVNPSAYGSVLQYDFGLCYCTFKTVHECEMGVRCPWRHHSLSAREKGWIEEIAREKGRRFIEHAEKCWAEPDVPVPGNNMIEVMQREQDVYHG
ncbi:hypothetical protein BU23DRAFT_603958 [Bimuria novae-zelandiae CBS 107.79]|uniref:Uncharacterized protein n=1 Tax=Bimuria novae-zelandiae CBS 107.79 TaxID=1447943 RepID=A0A6A5USM2_9PLEO|nr:hypothetical protein BU23DRAFT_603958 [Bimuria novae-zelandiae CBS 107.79]